MRVSFYQYTAISLDARDNNNPKDDVGDCIMVGLEEEERDWPGCPVEVQIHVGTSWLTAATLLRKIASQIEEAGGFPDFSDADVEDVVF